ncbi:hypothetical protein GGR58DRAFT_468757 [Xylaria digitata]|nr:hypothetical protein GGR58DRAFT_468757 [Xylaria digitata]
MWTPSAALVGGFVMRVLACSILICEEDRNRIEERKKKKRVNLLCKQTTKTTTTAAIITVRVCYLGNSIRW